MDLGPEHLAPLAITVDHLLYYVQLLYAVGDQLLVFSLNLFLDLFFDLLMHSVTQRLELHRLRPEPLILLLEPEDLLLGLDALFEVVPLHPLQNKNVLLVFLGMALEPLQLLLG